MAGNDSGRLRRWPPELRHPLFLGLAALYLLAVLARRGVGPPLPAPANSYLADGLALPLLLTLLLAFMRRLYFRRPGFVLPASWVFSTWAATAIWFELLLPRLRPHAATADWLDVLAYGAGGLLYWRWLNRPAPR